MIEQFTSGPKEGVVLRETLIKMGEGQWWLDLLTPETRAALEAYEPLVRDSATGRMVERQR